MAEPAAPAPAPAPDPPTPPAAPAPAAQPTEETTDWKAEARKWEDRAKENFQAAQRLKEFEDAQKTNEQKLTEALEQAKDDATTSRSELVRLQVALDKGLDAELVDFLPAGSREEIEAAAEKLLTRLGDPKRRTPRPTPSQGTSQGDPTLTPGDEFASWLRQKI